MTLTFQRSGPVFVFLSGEGRAFSITEFHSQIPILTPVWTGLYLLQVLSERGLEQTGKEHVLTVCHGSCVNRQAWVVSATQPPSVSLFPCPLDQQTGLLWTSGTIPHPNITVSSGLADVWNIAVPHIPHPTMPTCSMDYPPWIGL